MVGELNASHSGVRSGDQPTPITGRLGLKFDPKAYERRGRFRITKVVPLSPADVTGKVHAGDYLSAVNGKKLSGGVNLAALIASGMKRPSALDHGRTVEVRRL